MLSLEIENVISVPSAARVNFKVYGEMLPLNIHFFVVYALAVAIMYHFQCNPVGKVRVYFKIWVTWIKTGYVLVNIGE